jgi:threonine dehydrogenase-like Zn-dependent dehydrogenase
VEIEDVPEPTVIDGHVKVKVSRNGICGTDLHECNDGPIFVSPTVPHPLTGKAMPVILGHEFSGTITEIGSGVTTLHEGDRVTIEPTTAAASAGHAGRVTTTCAMSSAFTDSWQCCGFRVVSGVRPAGAAQDDQGAIAARAARVHPERTGFRGRYPIQRSGGQTQVRGGVP